ncbi:hypothetical protein EKG36_19290 [Halomonas nitroreducens]|uniref:Uncharacterized protein n=1 Tax=Halomonas nitroreducens TaxID=447425 RepID=A0A3S0I513_9GAMM|nr:hypothetical protein EKG36_19290 [Halomonas nitroreducens]
MPCCRRDHWESPIVEARASAGRWSAWSKTWPGRTSGRDTLFAGFVARGQATQVASAESQPVTLIGGLPAPRGRHHGDRVSLP